MSNLSPLAIALIRARKRANLLPAQLAARSGVSKTTLSKLETGIQKDCRSGTILRLAGALGVDPMELLDPPKPRHRRRRKAA